MAKALQPQGKKRRQLMSAVATDTRAPERVPRILMTASSK